MFKAELKNYRQSPRKVRLVADLIRGKKVNRALIELDFLNKRASLVVKKLIESAASNAKNNFNVDREVLVVKELRVDEGVTLKRWNPGSRGIAYPIKKRTSRILVVLSEEEGKGKKKVEKTEKKKEVNKKVKKETVVKKDKKEVKSEKKDKKVIKNK